MSATKAAPDSSSLFEKLNALSQNLWWSWNFEAQSIFRDLSPHVWERTHHNPVAVLAEMSNEEVQARIGDVEFAARIESAWESFDDYMSSKKTWASSEAKSLKGPVAYF